MSTADNDTISLAANIAKFRPHASTETIARTAGKLVKVCATLRKLFEVYPIAAEWDQAASEWMDKARELGNEVDAKFVALMPHNDPHDEPKFFLIFGKPLLAQVQI